MKYLIIASLIVLLIHNGYSQDFITKWTFSQARTSVQFSALTSDTVHYTWTASPSGNTGNGSFIQTSPDSVLLSGLDIMAGDTVALRMVPDHLSRFYYGKELDLIGLFDVAQWGAVSWTNMRKAFSGRRRFNITAIDTPDFNKVVSMDSMFYESYDFNDNISHWDVSNVLNMRSMFNRAYKFNQNIGSWNVSNVRDMSYMFFSEDIFNWTSPSSFNQDISNWDVSNVKDMSHMFATTTPGCKGCDGSPFDQDIGNWDVSNVRDMNGMFLNANSFNKEIGEWDVSNVRDMSGMFFFAQSFNQDIGSWDVSNVSRMVVMFAYAYTFNKGLENWNVSKVEDMRAMFFSASSFNQDLDNWNVSNVRDMSSMFVYAMAFNQDLGNWNISGVTDMSYMLDDSGMDCDHYSATLVGWQKNNPSVTDKTLGADGSEYGTSAEAARNALINDQGWTIEGDVASGMACDALVSSEFPLVYDHRSILIYPNPAHGNYSGEFSTNSG
ncbi:MAG: BspA family leucine-rich repeat surface protein [Candidatus Cyclobacteriaceae bacterium M2_1C_046]